MQFPEYGGSVNLIRMHFVGEDSPCCMYGIGDHNNF